MPKTIRFNQDDHLAKGEPGACNALVLEWLSNGGRPLEKRKRLFKRAAAVHERKVKFDTFADYGLELDREALEMFTVNNVASADKVVSYVGGLAHPMLLIGLSGSKGDHAIGCIKGKDSKGFDPNESYEEWDGSDKLFRLWVKIKILHGMTVDKYDTVLVYPITKHAKFQLPTQ
jgi:hypothetical protein